MTKWDADNLSAPHTQRELGMDAVSDKYGRRNVAKMIAEINILRMAIRAEGTPMIQQAWDAVEEHIDYAYRKGGAA